ncbi:MAG: MSHA biogenesis protein MshJ [Gammaproteobacteria bacterium]
MRNDMVNKVYKANADKFNELSIRERILFGFTILAVFALSWWHFFAAPMMAQIENFEIYNKQINAGVSSAQQSVDQIKARLEAGVHKEKKEQLSRLKRELVSVEEQLQLKATELVDPEEMFQLMTQLIYKESKLKLISLKRRGVKPALEPKDGLENSEGIYRHVLEVKFSGKYEDILSYLTSMESLDWKLIWEEINISSDEYPVINVKVVISTLSTRKEWVGV